MALLTCFVTPTTGLVKDPCPMWSSSNFDIGSYKDFRISVLRKFMLLSRAVGTLARTDMHTFRHWLQGDCNAKYVSLWLAVGCVEFLMLDGVVIGAFGTLW